MKHFNRCMGIWFLFLKIWTFEHLLWFHFSFHMGRNIYKCWKIPHFHFWLLVIIHSDQTFLILDPVPCVLVEDCYETAKLNITSNNEMLWTWEFTGLPLEINEAFAVGVELSSCFWGSGCFFPTGTGLISLWCLYCNMLMTVTFFRIYYSSRWHKWS